MTLILCITVGICIGIIAWGLHVLSKHPEYIEPVQEVPKHNTQADSYLIQAFINARWTLQAEIRNASSMAELSDLYWEIERLSEDYKDLIPDQLLITHIDELFAYHARTAAQLRKAFVLG